MLAIKPQLLLSMPSGGELVWVFMTLGILLLPAIFYLITLQNTLKAVSLQNRKMDPGLVWLMFIPLFNLVWHFIIVNRIADSLDAEYKSRGHQAEPRPTYNLGLTMCILACCGIIPIIGVLASLAGFIIWIIYWVKVNEHKNRLLQLPLHPGESQIF